MYLYFRIRLTEKCIVFAEINRADLCRQEIVGKGTLGKFSFIPCEIYKLDVTEEQKECFEKNIEFFKNKIDCF